MMNFMEHEKAWNEFTKTFPKKELSLLEAVAKEKDLMKKWRRLEKKVNQKMELIT